MNFRETLLERMQLLLQTLVIPEAQTAIQPHGHLQLTPNTGRGSALREIVIGPLAEVPAENPPLIPVAYLSFDGGQVDLTEGVLLGHVLENLSLRIELLLDKRIAVYVGGAPRDMELQASDVLHDIQALINLQTLASAVNAFDAEVSVTQVVLSEWGWNLQYRGGDYEVLTLIFQAAISKPHA